MTVERGTKKFKGVLLQTNPPWHHTILDQDVIDRILDAIPKVLVPRQIAHYCGLDPNRLYDWIKFGKRDMEMGKHNSIYADFLQQYNEKMAETLHKKLKRLDVCPRNYGAITWVLERAFKDDFETKSEAQKQLEDYVFNVIEPMLRQGGVPHVITATQEMDTENAHEERCITPRIGCATGAENTPVQNDQGTSF
jgi:hypothetical protein